MPMHSAPSHDSTHNQPGIAHAPQSAPHRVSRGGCGKPVWYDVVINGSRVIDPETRLDGVRNIGIIGDRIARISDQIRAACQVQSML